MADHLPDPTANIELPPVVELTQGRQPIDWHWWFGLSAVFATAFLALIAAVVFRGQSEKLATISQLRQERAEAAAQIDDLHNAVAASTEAQVCRDRFRVQVTDAQVDWQIAFGRLLSALSEVPRRDVTPENETLTGGATRLDDARKEQKAYQENPTIPCPLTG